MLKSSIKKGLASAMLLSLMVAPVMSVGAQSTVAYPEVQQIFVDSVLADGLTFDQWKILMEQDHTNALTEQGYVDRLWLNTDGKNAYDLFVEDGLANGKTQEELTISAFIASQQDRGDILSYVRWQKEMLESSNDPDLDVSLTAFIEGPAKQAYEEFIAANPNLDFPESSFLYELQFKEYFNQTFVEYLDEAQNNLKPITPDTYVLHFLPNEVAGKTEYDLWVEAKLAEGELEANLTPTHFVQLQPDYKGERVPIVEREEETPDAPTTPETSETPETPETSETSETPDENVKLSPNGQKYDRVEELSFERDVLENDTMAKGVEELITPGVKGSVYYLGDEEVDRVAPVNELVVVGTGKQVEETSETPKVTEPEVTEPKVTEPEVTEPKVTEPEVTEPEVTEPEVTEPEVTEPKPLNPTVTTQEPVETKVVIPFQTVQQNNPNLPVGTTRVIQEGRDGYSVNGRVVEAPVNKVIHIGTGQTNTVVPLNAGNGANYANTTTAQPLNSTNQNAQLTESGSKSATGWLLGALTTLGLGSILIFKKKDTEEV